MCMCFAEWVYMEEEEEEVQENSCGDRIAKFVKSYCAVLPTNRHPSGGD